MAAVLMYGAISWSAPAQAAPASLRASFSVTPAEVVAGQPVTFTDTTAGPHSVVLWVALGGSPGFAIGSSTFATTFANAGWGLVVLVVRGSRGLDVSLRLIAVRTPATVPTLQGQTVVAASQALAGAALRPGRETVVPSLLPAGEVVDTSPGAGSVIAAGSAVDYRVSNGVPVVTTVASGLETPSALTVDHERNLFIGVARGSGLVEISPTGGKTTLQSGLPGVGSGADGGVSALAVDADDRVYEAYYPTSAINWVAGPPGLAWIGGFPGGHDGIPFSPNQASDYGALTDFGFDASGLVTWLVNGSFVGLGKSPPGAAREQVYTSWGGSQGLRTISLALDPSGQPFVLSQNAIYRVGPGPVLTPVVGDPGGTAGDTGDGGPGEHALLNAPCNIRFDAFGNLYIADSGNGRIRRWNPTTDRIDTVLAGPGLLAPITKPPTPFDHTRPQVAFDKGNNMYVTDTGNGRVLKAWVVPPPGI
jgi:hypothetical protein